MKHGLFRSCNAPGGFTYVGLLLAVAILSIGLALTGSVWHAATQREKEKELLFAGDQIRAAITSFYEGSPGGAKRFPKSLEELIDDSRYPTTKRHLRQLYRDPMTNSKEWGHIESPAGGVMGVYSLSPLEPRKLSGFRARDLEFSDARSYAQWKFLYAAVEGQNETAAPAPPGTAGGGVDPIPPPSAPEPTPAAPPSRDDPNRKKICDAMQRADRNLCAGVLSQGGRDAGAACEQSVQVRYAACLDGRPLPPLATADGQER